MTSLEKQKSDVSDSLSKSTIPKNTEKLDDSLMLKSSNNFFSQKENSSFSNSQSSLRLFNNNNNNNKSNLISEEKNILNEKNRKKEIEYQNQDKNSDNNSNSSKNKKSRYNKLIIYLITLNASFSYLFIGINMGVTDTLHPTFRKLFNWNDAEERYYISLLNSVIPLGALIGALIISPFTLKKGRRLSLLMANFIGLIGTGIMNFVIIELMIFGRLLNGVVIGMNMSCVGIYVKEYVPYDIIGFCGGIYELCYAIGIFVAYLLGLNLPKLESLKGNYGYNDVNEMGNWWRFMLSCPLIFLVLSNLIFIFYFKHETPFYSFVFKKNIEETKKTLSQIYNEESDISNMLKDFEDYNLHQNSDISLSDIFSRKYRYRFFVVLIIQICQQACGIDAFVFYSDVFFMESIHDKYKATLLSNLLGIVLIISGIVTLLIIEKLGRKLLFIIGQIIILICLVLLAFFYYVNNTSPAIYLIMIYMFFNFSTIQPLTTIYTADVLPEIGIGICVAFNNIFSFLVTETFLHLKATYIGLTGLMLIYALFIFIMLINTVFCIKETKDLSSDKIDQMYSPKKIEPLLYNDESVCNDAVGNNNNDNSESKIEGN